MAPLVRRRRDRGVADTRGSGFTAGTTGGRYRAENHGRMDGAIGAHDLMAPNLARCRNGWSCRGPGADRVGRSRSHTARWRRLSWRCYDSRRGSHWSSSSPGAGADRPAGVSLGCAAAAAAPESSFCELAPEPGRGSLPSRQGGHTPQAHGHLLRTALALSMRAPFWISGVRQVRRQVEPCAEATTSTFEHRIGHRGQLLGVAVEGTAGAPDRGRLRPACPGVRRGTRAPAPATCRCRSRSPPPPAPAPRRPARARRRWPWSRVRAARGPGRRGDR